MILVKLVRGEQRDVDYAKVAVRTGLVDSAVLQSRIHDLPVDAAVRSWVESIVVGLVARDVDAIPGLGFPLWEIPL